MRSKFDPIQISQYTFDEGSNAVKTKLVDTEMSIELSHKDGDSVITHPESITISAIGVEISESYKEIMPPIPCISLKRIMVTVEGKGRALVYASPQDSGNFFYQIGTDGQIIDICARRIRVISEEIEGNVHLVGQS